MCCRAGKLASRARCSKHQNRPLSTTVEVGTMASLKEQDLWWKQLRGSYSDCVRHTVLRTEILALLCTDARVSAWLDACLELAKVIDPAEPVFARALAVNSLLFVKTELCVDWAWLAP